MTLSLAGRTALVTEPRARAGSLDDVPWPHAHGLGGRDDAGRARGRHADRPLGLPSDAPHLISLLCSDEAACVTGQVIDADGGLSL